MHPPEIRTEALRLIAAGLTDGAISRELDLPRTTVRDMRRPRRVDRPRCHRCWRPTRSVRFTAGEYAELLGLYLGDGDITTVGRTQRLRLSLDTRHGTIVDEAVRLLSRCFPRNGVDVLRRDDGATSVVYVYSSHLACLLPQHGAGKKHMRPIALEDWQRVLVEQAPWSFLRGLVHSDGCFFINRTGPYRYLSVCFDNRSDDIRTLFVDVCDRVGVRCRPSGTSVRIYGREDVANFAAFVGAKW
jgi:hypothetical protein